MASLYACSRCHGELRENSAGYLCSRCAAHYPVANGIPDFCPDIHLYWGELSPEEMREVVESANQSGYERAAETALRYSPGLRDYLLQDSRIDWLFHCLPVAGFKRCLDIGSGWGALARGLLKIIPQVWSLEIMPERLVFQEAFRRTENLAGLTLLRGTANRLPFQDEAFDLVVANGIIQWVGLADHSRSVVELQEEFLRECRRVLRPDGVLIMGCENRMGFVQLAGGKDHSGLPFTSVMPRKMADWTVRHFRKTGGRFVRSLRTESDWKDYRTYTYTVAGYEELLKRCGFAQVDSFWAYPADNLPSVMGRVDNGRSFAGLLEFTARTKDAGTQRSFAARTALKTQSLASLPAVGKQLGKLSSDFVFFARPDVKSSENVTLEDLAGPYTVRTSGSHKVMWWNFEDSGTREVVKIARFPNDESKVRREEQQISEFNEFSVENETHEGRSLYREPILDIRRIQALDEQQNRAALSKLLEMQDHSARGFWDAGTIDREIERNYRNFCSLASDDELRKTTGEACNHLRALMASAKLPVVAEHGDFQHKNLLQDQAGRLLVFDWYNRRSDGEPLFDFAVFSYAHWQAFGNGSATHSPLLAAMIASFAAHRQVAEDLVYAYYPYALVRRALGAGAYERVGLIKLLRKKSFPQRNA